MTGELDLMRSEYSRLQSRYTDVRTRYETLLAENTNRQTDELESTFTGRLVTLVGRLYGQQKYSDLDVVTDGKRIRGHRLVFVARSDYWGDLEDVEEVELPTNFAVTSTILKWMYSSVLEDQWGESFLLDVMKGAATFRLDDLAKKCEELLITRIEVDNCIKLYQDAESLGFAGLRDACASFISTSWSQFDAKHFEDVEARLLYQMLKGHCQQLLHSIVGLKREDVLSLYLDEHSNHLDKLVNTPNDESLFPLDLALNSDQFAMAQTLCTNGADVNRLDVHGRSFISKAIESGNVKACEFLVDRGANINYVNEETGETLIHDLAKSATIRRGISEFCMQNIDRFDLNTRDKQGRTPLLVSIEHNSELIFDLILDQSNVDVNLVDRGGRSPLKESLFGGHDLAFSLSVASKLIDHGADVDHVDSKGNTYMHTAALDGNFAVVQFLAKQNVEINKKNQKGSTVLHCFLSSLSSGGKIDEKQSDILNVLLKSGADPTIIEDETDFSALHFAVQRNQLTVLSCLLESNNRKMPLDVLDQEGRSPLWCALTAGKFEAAKLLVSAGADVDEGNKEQDVILLRAIRLKRDDIVQFLLQNRANSTIKGKDGSLPLHLAIEAGMTSVCDSLCRLGTNLNSPHPRTGVPPIWIALQNEDYGTAQVLIGHGCDLEAWTLNADGVDETLLHRAIDERNEKAAIFLIKNGSDVNALQKSLNENKPTEQTPLHLSVQWGLMEVAKALVSNLKCKTDAPDENGRTAAHIAVLEKDREILELLLSHPNPAAGFSLRDKWGQTPLSIAMKHRDNKAAELICKRIPHMIVQVNGNGENLLHVAIKSNDFESVLFLLGLQIDVNIPVQDEVKSTPLHICAEFGSEIVMRNLLLAGAAVDAQNELGQTPLHIAATHDRADLLGILLNEPNGDPNIVDNEGNSCVHCVVAAGHVKTTQFLFLESEINPVNPLAVNKLKRNIVHLCAGVSGITAAEMFQTIIECYPNFPLEAPDISGNTIFLLAFINGNAELCKLLLKYGVCLGAANHSGETIFRINTPTKQLLFDLLNGLDREPRWTSEGEFCSECEAKFTITMRKHHCRHCGRLICAKCSEQQIPILKYGLSKSVRVCQMCFSVLL